MAFVPKTNEEILLSLVNQYREKHGIQSLTLDSKLCSAAQSHAKFMASNNVLSHYEDKNLKDFFGINLEERATRVGWYDTLSELVGYSNTTIQENVRAIFDSPCHRVRFLKPGKLVLGAASESEFVCLLVGGDATPQMVISPPDHEENVPLKWLAKPDFSGTNTGKGSKSFGYPITISLPNRNEKPISAKHIEFADGEKSVPIIIRDSTNDSHFEDSIAIIPESPLAPHTTYQVKVSFDDGLGNIINKAWTFTTGD